jgi:hypothetical protein
MFVNPSAAAGNLLTFHYGPDLPNAHFSISLRNGGKVNVGILENPQITSTDAVATDTWAHLAVVVTSEAGTLTGGVEIYVNAIAQGANTLST